MTQSGKSLFYFGIYAVCSGLLFILIPGTLISLVHLPSLPAGWGRIIGLLALVIGTYDIICGMADIKLFIRASVYVRLGFAAGTVLLIVFGQMPLPILLFGAVDALGAVWTAIALKAEASAINALAKKE